MMDAYHDDYSCLSQSMLKVFADRRRLYQKYFVTREVERPPPSQKMELGTMVHAALLEPEKAPSLLAEIPADLLSGANKSISSNAAKAWVAEQKAAGRIPLKPDQINAAMRMVEAIQNSEAGKWLAAATHREHTIRWHDLTAEIDCRMMADAIILQPERVIGLDVKTTGDASPFKFASVANAMRYWLQDAHYRNGLETEFNVPAEFYFVVIETDEPFSCSVHRCDEPDKADQMRLTLIESLKRCHETDDWREPWEQVVNHFSIRWS